MSQRRVDFGGRLAEAGRRLGALFGKRADVAVDVAPAARAPRPEGCMLWVVAEEAASLGAAPVVAKALSELIDEDVHLVVSSADGLAGSSPFAETALVGELPADGGEAGFLDHWAPDFGLIIDDPKSAALFEAASARGIALYHAASQRDGTGARRPKAYLQHVHTCLAASAAEADALRQQLRGKGVSVEIVGPLSDTVLAPACNDAECDQLAALLGGRPVWLAASVDQDEIPLIERAHRKAFRSAHRLLLILVPRDPSNAAALAASLEDSGWQTGLRSRGDDPDPDTQVYIADTEDELGLWYRLAPSTFVGGTLVPEVKPSDPFQPAALGSAVLHGPFTDKAPARFRRLGKEGASILVRTADELGEAVITLLSPDKAASLAQAGWATTTESASVVERLAELMLAEFDAMAERV